MAANWTFIVFSPLQSKWQVLFYPETRPYVIAIATSNNYNRAAYMMQNYICVFKNIDRYVINIVTPAYNSNFTSYCTWIVLIFMD